MYLWQGYQLLQSLHTPDGIPMDEDAKHVHFQDFSDVSGQKQVEMSRFLCIDLSGQPLPRVWVL